MSNINSNLLTNVVTSYDQTKTTIFGRVSEKTIGGVQALGPAVPQWADVFTDTAFAPGGVCMSRNIVGDIARIFVVNAFGAAGANAQVALYNYNMKTGVMTYVGKIIAPMPNSAATTQTLRGVDVIDSGTTGWKICFNTTATITINGGTFLLNNLALTDFTPLGTTIPLPTGNDQKAIYMLQDPAFVGVNNQNILSAGLIIESGKLYVHNGVAATHQYYVFDLTVAPTFTENTVTLTNSNPGVITLTAHGFLNNDPVIFKTTGAVSGLTTATVYFARNVTANTFELSLTSGGASISTVGTQSGTHNIARAFGISTSTFTHKTGNLPALVGILLTNNCENPGTPQDASYGGLVGNACVGFATSTNLYMGKLSELTVGTTTWPSLTTANNLGSVNEVVSPTITAVQYSQVLDCFVFISNVSYYYGKRLVNNSYLFKGGRLNTSYQETFTYDYGEVVFGVAALQGITIANGVALLLGSTVGQRGIISCDMRSDYIFDQDYIITKVMDAEKTILNHFLETDKLYDYSNVINVEYRLSGFGSSTGGWLPLSNSELLNIYIGSQIQFKISFATIGFLSQTPAQLSAFQIIATASDAITTNFEYSHDDSSTSIPTRAAFRLKHAYDAGTIPTTLAFRAFDLSGTQLVDHDITNEDSNFEYSTDNGTSWLALGTIPNTVGTLVRYNFTSPPGVDIRVALQDE